MLHAPHGMILVTGPTGSGKTTTLYGALAVLNQPDRKLITIEDPVEYQIAGINQVLVKPSIGLTFAAGLRSILRQAPDVIMAWVFIAILACFSQRSVSWRYFSHVALPAGTAGSKRSTLAERSANSGTPRNPTGGVQGSIRVPPQFVPTSPTGTPVSRWR